MSLSTMASGNARFDYVRDVDAGFDHNIWRMKVRVLQLWKVPNTIYPSQDGSIEMVVVDEMADRIQVTVKSIHTYLFERVLSEGNVYIFSNFIVALNDQVYRPTKHEFRMFFKRDTQARLVEDFDILKNVFKIVPFSDVLSA
ncbi:hypothetical protein RJT34_03291 [Clitoria ternatea]|uniref:Replication protein A 70 kDa DNA-binding subunit B/D first OB fold domain-containing protein n=1 Tax=Clitoria ternatea TaxID=43366 RepID=A0AAN9Q4Y2_CLITE